MQRLLFLLVVTGCSLSTLWAQKDVRRNIRTGNAQYEKKQYLESEISYRKALETAPDDSIARFDLGNTLYRQQKGDDALAQYLAAAAKALDGEQHELASKAFYNAGNVMMAAQQYGKAVSLYKQALRQNPSDDEARYNMLLAQKLSRQQQDQQQDENNQENQQQEEQEEQEEQENQQQNNEDQDQQNQNDQNDEDQEQQSKQDDSSQDKQKSDPKQNQSEPQDNDRQQMTPEQAEQILQAAQLDEKETQQKVQEAQMRKVRQKRTERDW